MKTDNRREFLRKSILGISGVALVPGIMKGNTAVSESKTAPPELPQIAWKNRYQSSAYKHGYFRYIFFRSYKGCL